MKVGWFTDQPGYVGGAEMTQAEFQAAAPEGVEVFYCPPGAKREETFDCAVVNNVVQYHPQEFEGLENVWWYHHDLSPHNRPDTKAWLDDNARHIFCSAFQRDRYGLDGEVVPPPLDLSRYRPPREIRRGKRTGVCSIAQWRSFGKGPDRLDEWAHENGPVDVYGEGEMVPRGENINYKGALSDKQVPQALWDHETFVFLPTEPEPFCRSVMEAHAAGCKLVVNKLIGALEYLDDPSPVENAAETFWGLLCA